MMKSGTKLAMPIVSFMETIQRTNFESSSGQFDDVKQLFEGVNEQFDAVNSRLHTISEALSQHTGVQVELIPQRSRTQL